YSGSIPIKTDDGRILAYAHVVVAAGQQSLFRGESPAVLRSESQENIEGFYRPITVSEFHDNRLLTSSSTFLPINYQLASAVQAQFSDLKRASLWHEERFDNKSYETFYIRRPSSPNEVVALSVPQLGLEWHLIS